MQTILKHLMIAAVMLLVAGCTGGPQVKKAAFAKPQTLAIVTISGSVHGIYTTDVEDVKILAESAPTCFSELAKSHNIRLLPAKSALSSKAYAAIKDDGAMFSTMLISGYKRFSPEEEKKNLKALAKEMHVDGFLIMYLMYSKSESGVSIGFVQLGSVKPAISYTVQAVNPEGETIWNDQISVTGEEGIGTVMGIGGYSSLIPKLNALTQSACKQSVKNLADQVAAK